MCRYRIIIKQGIENRTTVYNDILAIENDAGFEELLFGRTIPRKDF